MNIQSDKIIGTSPSFLDLMDKVSRAAPLDRPILVIGERGTGKELVAARLHYLSRRWDHSFQKMNCAALTHTLLESELFGHEQGAFTGAKGRRAGRFEAADNGSLFLDEIGTMSMAAQEKLLRVIEYGEFERVGGNETIHVDTRVIGATNIDLPSAAEAGLFRHDLLDRLAFDVITLPPLRHRREDIMLLANHFGLAMARELEWLQFPGFSDIATEQLMDHSWPGNIRELKNVVERAIYCAWDGEQPVCGMVFDPFESPYRPNSMRINAPQAGLSLPLDDLSSSAQHKSATNEANKIAAIPDTPFDLKQHIASHEKQLLQQTLEQNKYNQRAAAQWLHMTYDQLRHALKKHDLLGS